MTTKKTKTVGTNDVKTADPSLVELIARAGRHYANGVKSDLQFCETYVLICSLYGSKGKKAIQDKYAFYTDTMWSRVECIGKHVLLPQFRCCSGSFVQGILRIKNSLEKQAALVAMVKDGKFEFIDQKGKIVLKSLADLSKVQEELILFAMNNTTSVAEIRRFAYDLRKEWRDTSKPKRPDWEGVGDVVRINHAVKIFTKADWLAMGRIMGWNA